MKTRRFRNVDQTFFERIDTEEKAYFLGFLYADGYNSTEGNYFVVTLSAVDRDILTKMKKALKSDAVIKSRKGGAFKLDGEYITMQVNSKKMCGDLADKGCIQCKSDFIRFPFWLDKSLWSHFVRGYFDGDGGFSKEIGTDRSPGHIKYRANIVSNPQFIADLNEIFFEVLGKRFYILRYYKHKRTEQLRIEGNRQVESFMSWLYQDATVFLDRKHRLYLELLAREYHDKKPVFVYLKKNNQFLGRFDSRLEAGKVIGICHTTISKNMTGKLRSRTHTFSPIAL